jgi:hypothetical protein
VLLNTSVVVVVGLVVEVVVIVVVIISSVAVLSEVILNIVAKVESNVRSVEVRDWVAISSQVIVVVVV